MRIDDDRRYSNQEHTVAHNNCSSFFLRRASSLSPPSRSGEFVEAVSTLLVLGGPLQEVHHVFLSVPFLEDGPAPGGLADCVQLWIARHRAAEPAQHRDTDAKFIRRHLLSGTPRSVVSRLRHMGDALFAYSREHP